MMRLKLTQLSLAVGLLAGSLNVYAVDTSANDFGMTGVLQTPTARMREAGDLSFSVNQTEPYTRINMILQPFDWLQGGFRSELKLTLFRAPAAANVHRRHRCCAGLIQNNGDFRRRLAGGGDMGGLVGMPQLPVNDEHASQRYHQRQGKGNPCVSSLYLFHLLGMQWCLCIK